MKLSIIIPVYNVEQYLEKCLLSCLNQDIPNNEYEIIVVNDGSPDGSLAIAERIAATANNITIISQENGGLSAARNTGLSLAKGDYVWFIDSDDWIESNCLAELTKDINGVDVIHIGHNLVYSSHIVANTPKEIKEGEDILKRGFYQPAPFYIMRREFLIKNNLCFMKGIYHEDMEFTPRMLYMADRIITTQCCVYNYLQRESSIMTTPNPKRAFDLIKVTESLYNFKREKVTPELKYIFSNTISLGLNNAFNIISKANVIEQNRWVKELKNKRHIVSELLNSKKAKYRIQGYIYSIVPMGWYINIYRFMQLFNKR